MGCSCGLGEACIGKCEKIPAAASAVAWSKGRVNTLPRPIGLEVELAEWGSLPAERDRTYTDREVGLTYTVVRDGSVHPSELEMNLQPWAGDRFLSQVLKLAEMLHNAAATVNETCGLHVHVDGRDFSYWDARKLVRLYARLETAIYTHFVAPSRRRNQHCRRLYDTFWTNEEGDRETFRHRVWIERVWGATSTWEIKDLMWQWIYQCHAGHQPGLHGKEQHQARARWEATTTLAQARRQQRVVGHYGHYLAQPRYLGLNVHSWMHRGTWEWRMKEGTLDPDQLVFWPLLCGWMVHLSTAMRDSEIENMTMRRFIDRLPRFVRQWAAEQYHPTAEEADA